MREELLVSFIIPTYNRAEIISETLQSIQQQSYPNWECIVVDDGSTDHTLEVVKSFVESDERFSYALRPENRKKGGNAARNYGFELSKGDFVNFVDSDDLIHQDKLKLQLNVFSQAPNSKVCLSEAEIFNDSKTYQKKSKVFDEIAFFEDYISRKLDMGTTQPLWRRKFLENAPMVYDENILRGQDFDFLSRMSTREDFEFCYVQKVLVSVRIGNSGRISKMGYKKEVAQSYLDAFFKTYKLVLKQKYEEKIYIEISNLLLKRILKCIASKDFETSTKYLRKMNNEVYENKNKYHLHFIKLLGYLKILRFTNLKGYSLLRKNYYLS